jgi:hypothetical protein
VDSGKGAPRGHFTARAASVPVITDHLLQSGEVISDHRAPRGLSDLESLFYRMQIEMHPWLKALRHDLVKRAVWPARDLRDAGGRDLAALRRGLTELTGPEGEPIAALLLWERMRADAPAGVAEACDAFGATLRAAVAALDRPWPAPLDAVLAMEVAFAALARAVEEKGEK